MKEGKTINNINKIIQKERNILSQELFNKDECYLQISELKTLNDYIYDLEHPVWKDVLIGVHKTNYKISNTGLLWNIKLKKLSKPYVNHKGYYGIKIHFKNENECINTFVHRLVAQAFIPNPENKPQVNHINGNKKFNWWRNLEWVTNSENQIHAYSNGLRTPKCGINHGNCKNTEEKFIKYVNF